MPVYNSYDRVRSEGKNLLEVALKSILTQTYVNFELIILDNQSIDKTPKVCMSYAKKDRRIKYIRDTKKRYPEGAITHLASFANGSYCMIANDDDVWDKNYIATLINYLQNHKDVDLCYSNGQYVDINGHKLNQLVPSNKYVYSIEDFSYSNFLKFLRLRNIIPIAFGLYKTKVFKDTLPYHKFDNLKANVDNLFMMKFFLRNHRVDFINKDLFYYRRKIRALDPSKVINMPPLTHPVDIWSYYGIHQINFHLQTLKLVNKNVHNNFFKMLAKNQSLASCIKAILNLLNWITIDVVDNFSDRKKLYMAIASWKYYQFSGKKEGTDKLKSDLRILQNIVNRLSYQSDNKYLTIRKKFIYLIQNEIDKIDK